MSKDHIILVGQICAGKNQVAQILHKSFHYHPLVFSDILRDQLLQQGLPITRTTQQQIGNQLRQQYGPDALAQLIVQKATKAQLAKVVYDGARHPAEIEYIRAYFPDRTLVLCIQAPLELRFQRLLSRKRPGDPQTLEEFHQIDSRENQGTTGQNTQRNLDTMALSDITIQNVGSLDELSTQITQILA
jgi:dephospho-CoA kinase